ncbi:MAG: response regulator transcription factor [Candidatus Falkowbacteria bacterium]
MKILIIEDDLDISKFLKMSLESEFFVVDECIDGAKGSFLARTNEYDLIIVDYSLPTQNGDEVVREIRADGKTMPIIMLTVNAEMHDKLKAFEIGVDDYLGKPFVFEELLARVRALLRRPGKIEAPITSIGDLIIDDARHKVWRGNKEIYLTKKEFCLLKYLLQNQGKPMSRAMIMEHVWEMEVDPFSNTVESHILKLRKKININKRSNLIYNISGHGYKMDLKK